MMYSKNAKPSSIVKSFECNVIYLFTYIEVMRFLFFPFIFAGYIIIRVMYGHNWK